MELFCDHCETFVIQDKLSGRGVCGAFIPDPAWPIPARLQVQADTPADHCEAFWPTESCRREMDEAEKLAANPAEYYGVTAGVDFPGTLRRVA